MSTYNATLWPNLQTPAAVNIGAIGAAPTPPPIKNEQIPAATSTKQNFTAAAVAPNTSTVLDPNTTANEIKTTFQINPLFDPFNLAT